MPSLLLLKDIKIRQLWKRVINVKQVHLGTFGHIKIQVRQQTFSESFSQIYLILHFEFRISLSLTTVTALSKQGYCWCYCCYAQFA